MVALCVHASLGILRIVRMHSLRYVARVSVMLGV